MTESAVPAAATTRRRATLLPWEQQVGENDLWFSRFLRYVALGPRRSVSLVATGERNHYPVPAHWPMVAKQRDWRARAQAFDEAARNDEVMVTKLNDTMQMMATIVTSKESAQLAEARYQPPPPTDDDESADSLD